LNSSPTGSFNNLVDISGILYASHGFNGIYRSADSAVSWQQINSGLVIQQSKQVYEIISYEGNLYAATVDGIYKSTNDGGQWVKKSSGITVGPGATYIFAESIYEHNGILFTGAWNGIYRSTDGAESWMLTNVSGQGISAKNFTDHNDILFAARENINFPNGYKSTDDGVTWQALTNILLPTITFLSEPPLLWAGTIDGVRLSTNNGDSWITRNDGLSSDPYNSSIIRVNGVLLTSLHFGGSGLYASTNEGILWEDFHQGLPFLNRIDKLIVYDTKIIAVTSDGLWQRNISDILPVELVSFTSVINGNSVKLNWSTASELNNRGFEVMRKKTEGRGQQSEWELAGFVEGNGTTSENQYYSFTDKNILQGKYSYRLKQIDFDGTFSYSDEIEIEISSPDKFELSQNYPNPFNPSTKIVFTISPGEKGGKQEVLLKVYDVLGNEVATLVNEF
jgi:hypothetical protein